jgi:hypothetical protein
MAALRALTALVLVAGARALTADMMEPVGTSPGSCYDSTTHIVSCFVSEEKCAQVEKAYYYAPGYTSGMDGCCHCATSCPNLADSLTEDFTRDLTNRAGETETKVGACTGFYDTYDDYVSVSNVMPHGASTLDVMDFETHINDAKYDEAKKIYTEGKNSPKGTGMRTLQGFAQKDLTGEPMFDGGKDLFGSATFLDDMMMSVLDGTGLFKGASDDVRDQGADKTAQCIMAVYAAHEFDAAIVKAKDGNTADSGAPHAWDEGVAFWYGPAKGNDGVNSVSEVQMKRDKDFGTDFRGLAMTSMQAGLTGTREGTLDIAMAEKMYQAILMSWMATFAQAGLKYSYKYSRDASALPDGVEGYAYWRCGAPIMMQFNAEATKAMDAAFQASMTTHDPDLYCKIQAGTKAVMKGADSDLADLGTYDFSGITCRTPPPDTESSSPAKSGDTDEASPAIAAGIAAGVVAAALL